MNNIKTKRPGQKIVIELYHACLTFYLFKLKSFKNSKTVDEFDHTFQIFELPIYASGGFMTKKIV